MVKKISIFGSVPIKYENFNLAFENNTCILEKKSIYLKNSSKIYSSSKNLKLKFHKYFYILKQDWIFTHSLSSFWCQYADVTFVS